MCEKITKEAKSLRKKYNLMYKITNIKVIVITEICDVI